MQPLKAYDWVRDTRSGMKRPIVQLQPNCIALTNPEEYSKHFIKWVPEPGDWCWFFNDDRIPTISQFVEINEDMTRKYFAVYPNRPHALGSWYKYCEPFIGELPFNIKIL